MRCIKCGGMTKVIDSRSIEEGTFRKRRCEGCGREFYTEEYETDTREGLNAGWKAQVMKKFMRKE